MTRKKADRKSDQLRQALANETAKIITVEGVRDYHRAKLKACERLGNSRHGSLPSNFEIEQAITSFKKTFIPDYDQKLFAERQIALVIMQWLQDHAPLLVVSVIEGAVGINAPISIHVSSETVEIVIDLLRNRNIELKFVERRLKLNNEFVFLPTINFEYKNYDIEVVVFDSRQRHQKPKSKCQNRSMQRMSIKALTELLAIN